MKVIVAGSRNITSTKLVYSIIEKAINIHGWNISEIVSGHAPGVDTVGESWAAENNIPVVTFPADWEARGRAAGPLRNAEMAEYADALIAVPSKSSKGTYNMIMQAANNGLSIFIHKYWEEDDIPTKWDELSTVVTKKT